jgi:aryl carrier-like protein
MYASGDLVCVRPVDGSITYLGRRNTQIKIRGLRVELGEIEEVLKTTNDAVVNAVVIKVDIGREALIAFIECRSATQNPDITLIRDDTVGPLSVYMRQAVHQKLPTYMAPATYVFLNRLPLTASGKLNRNALHSYFLSHEKEIREFELHNEADSDVSDPGRTRETELHTSIKSPLCLRPGSFGIDDDFYMVGRDSISAIRLASAARGAGIQLVATDVIEHPTIRAMARVSQSATVNHDFDDDDAPSITLDQMVPKDLTLMNLDRKGLDALQHDLLPKHHLSPRYAQVHLTFAGTHNFLQ